MEPIHTSNGIQPMPPQTLGWLQTFQEKEVIYQYLVKARDCEITALQKEVTLLRKQIALKEKELALYKQYPALNSEAEGETVYEY